MLWYDALDADAATGGSARAEDLLADEPGGAPLYDVVLLDDDDHCYYYVVDMLVTLFGYDVDTAYRMTKEVDSEGRVVVFTAPFADALAKCEAIRNYGPDPWLVWSTRSMEAIVERATARADA